MGQYHIPANLDKREYIMPHRLGDGLKLMEQAMSGPGGTGSALLLLLAVSNGETGRGGGDFRPEGFGDVIGRWGGDRIVLIGDYAEESDYTTSQPDDPDPRILYALCHERGEGDEDLAEFYRQRATQAEESGNGILYGVDADDYRQWADYVDRHGNFTDITDRVVEALEAEGYMRYSGDGWRDRSYSWEEVTTR